MPITLLEQTAASVPTPTTNKLTLFVESVDGLVKTKDDVGTVATLGAIANGDKGDITTSAGGATWTIDNDAVTYAKMQNVSAAERLLGRGAGGGAGDVQEVTLGSGLSFAGTVLSASGGSAPFDDGTAIIKGSADATKLFRIEVDGFTTATTRVATPPNADFTMAGINIAQTFTATQTFTPAVNTSALVVTGASLTGTDATSFLSFAGTFNTTGTPTFLDVNLTDTASNAASLLFNLRVGGTSKFNVSKAGRVAADSITATTGTAVFYLGSNAFSDGLGLTTVGGSTVLSWSTVCLSNDAASDVLAMKRGTNPNAFRVYYSYTDGSNYHRMGLQTGADYVEVAAETAGTGADNLDVRLTPVGTGNVRFGTHSAIAAETVTGYVTIKDAGGTTRKVAVVS